MTHPLRALREAGAGRSAYAEILAPDVVFHSPIFALPVHGRELVLEVMAQSVQVRDGSYTCEMRDGNKTVLVWSGSIEGRKLESFELIEDDAQGKILSRTVAMRPFPSVAVFRAAMRQRLSHLLPEEYWALPEAG